MNNELKFDLKQLKLYYYTFRYSQYYGIFIPSVSLVTFLMILWLFFIPEIQSWFSLRNEVAATQDRIRHAKSNLQYLQLLNENIVENDFAAATAALPPEKDFAAVLSVISEAAANAQVQVDDFSFILGDVAQAAQPQDPNAATPQNDEPVTVAFGLTGTPSDINRFIKEVESNVPLTQLKALDFVEGKAHIQLAFYARAFPDIVYNDTEPIDTLSTQEKNLLLKLRGWQ